MRVGFSWLWVPLLNVNDNFNITTQRAVNDDEIGYVNSLPARLNEIQNLSAGIQARGVVTTAEYKKLRDMSLTSVLSVPARSTWKLCDGSSEQTVSFYDAQLMDGVTIEATMRGQEPVTRARIIKNGQAVGTLAFQWERRPTSWDLVRRDVTLQDGLNKFQETVNVTRTGAGGLVPRNTSGCYNSFASTKTNLQPKMFKSFQTAPSDQFLAVRERGPSCNNTNPFESFINPQDCYGTYYSAVRAIDSREEVACNGSKLAVAGLLLTLGGGALSSVLSCSLTSTGVGAAAAPACLKSLAVTGGSLVSLAATAPIALNCIKAQRDLEQPNRNQAEANLQACITSQPQPDPGSGPGPLPPPPDTYIPPTIPIPPLGGGNNCVYSSVTTGDLSGVTSHGITICIQNP
jgi:hypothetical protein